MFQARARRVGVLVAAAAVVSSLIVAPADAQVIREGAPAPTQADVDAGSAMIVLKGDPLSTSTKVTRGKRNRVEMNGAGTKSVRAQLSAQRNEFKKWLQQNAPKAQITGQYDIALNAVAVRLNGTSLATLRTAPQVESAELQGVYRKTEAVPVDPDLALVNAIQGWGSGGAANAGKGVKVAIIDSGIDQSHPCFDDMGDNGNTNDFVNNKVVVAKVFNNKAGSRGYTPEAIDSHGTHVAGTVACDYLTTAKVGSAEIPYQMSGVAPAALLGNYNVFPGTVEDARDEDILNALEAAYADGMDVANMSLGGGYRGIQDLTSKAVDNLDRAGMVIAVSAGNEGPGFSTTGSPGRAERALTAGASSVAHAVLNQIHIGDDTVIGELGDFGGIDAPLTGTLDVVVADENNPDASPIVTGVALACAPVPDAPAADGYIAVIARGVCDFAVKMRYVQAAGYDAAIVINRLPGLLVMAGDSLPDPATIPGLMVSLDDKDTVVAGDGTEVTIDTASYLAPFGDPNVTADFTSEGPTRVDWRIKPDVVAPGVNVLSSVPGGDFALFSGTSMAAPHLAGAAAVVLSQRPTWQPWQVRSAIVNTADLDALTPYYDNPDDDPNLIGSGLLQVDRAVAASALLSQVSVSFGMVPSGSGQQASRTIQVTDASGAPLTVAVSVEGATEPWFTATGGNGSIKVNVTVPKGAPAGGAWATVEVRTGATEVAHFRVYVLVG